MKLKKLFIIACIFICLLAMASVCAGEVNDTKIASESAGDDLTIDEAMASTNLLENNDDEMLGDSDDGSFNALKSKIENAQAGSIIYLENNYLFDDSASSGGIEISKSITVYGKGHTIDAQGKGRIFYISTTESVNLYDITFKNAHNYDGGAIYVSDNFYGNINCSFFNNSAQNEGGAIYIYNNCFGNVSGSFVNNSAGAASGAIYIYNNCFGNLSGWFVNNSAGDAGAIFVRENVSGSVSGWFVNNSAAGGGAIWFGGDVSGSVSGYFFNNSATAIGGAIWFGGDVSGSVSGWFVNNSAAGGGAIWFGGDVSGSVSGFFVNNSAGNDHGGAIHMRDVSGSVSGFFVNNSAGGYGGSIFMGDVSGNLTGFFVNNSAGGYGGSIFMGDVSGSVSGCFVDNSAGDNGGAIYLIEVYGSVSGCFVNNSAGNGSGGAIWGGYFSGNLTGSFVDNSAATGGAIYLSTYDSGAIYDSIFINNNGTSIFVENGGNIDAFNSWFGNDVSNYNIKPQAGNVEMENWLFLNPKASPNIVPVLTTSDVSFKLYSYNGSSQKVDEYDNSLLKPTILEIAVANGNVDRNTVNIGGTVKFSANNVGISRVTAAIGNNIFTVELNVIQATTKITAPNVKTVYNKNKYLTVTLTDDKGTPISGEKITIQINGKKTYTTDKNGQVKVKVAKLVPKTYKVKIAFAGSPNFKTSQKTVKVTVTKAKAKITAKKKTFKAAKKVKKYAVTLKSGKLPIKKVKLTLKINGKTYKAKTNKKGKATFKLKLNKKGNYKAVIKFKANKYYKKATKKVKIIIK